MRFLNTVMSPLDGMGLYSRASGHREYIAIANHNYLLPSLTCVIFLESSMISRKLDK